MDEQEGYGEGGTGGTGGGGHGESGHVPRGEPDWIGAETLYFLVVTAGTIVALAAIWLCCYGAKRCQKMWRNRSQRRVGCFPTEETSIALSEGCTHGSDVRINMETEGGEVAMEPKTFSNEKKADYTVVNMFDDEEELESHPQQNGSLEGISRNSDVRIQMNDEKEQKKEEKISTGICEREDAELNQNETLGNEICQLEAQALEVPETKENLRERIQLAQVMPCAILMEAIHEDTEDESSSEESFTELNNGHVPNTNDESSDEGDTEPTLSMTCEREDHRESDQNTEDESYGSESSDEEQQPFNAPRTVDYYETIQLGRPMPQSMIMDAPKQEMDDERGNEGPSIMADSTEEEVGSDTASQKESQTNGQLESTGGITQQSAEQAQAMSLRTMVNSEKRNYANSAGDNSEEREKSQITDDESSDEASMTSSSAMTTDYGDDWEGYESYQLEVQASFVPEAMEVVQENTKPTETDLQTLTMDDNDYEAGTEPLFQEVESSQVIGDLVLEEIEPEKAVLAALTGKGDQERIPKDSPFSVLNKIAGLFDENRSEDVTFVYTLTTDEEPPQSPSAQPNDTLAVESDPPMEISDGTPEVAPSTSEGTSDSPRPKRRITPVHQVRSEGELADPAATDAPDMPSSAWQTALKLDPDVLEYAQAEGGWMRKKLDNSVARPTHHTTLGNTDDVLGIGPGILTTILEPVNRFLAQIISPDESQMQLIEPDEPAQLNTEDFDDSDQEAIRAAVSRITQPKKTGIVSFLNFCQAEGSPHEQENLPRESNFPEIFTVRPSNAALTPRLHEEEDKPPPTDEELEQQEIEAYAKMAPQLEAQLAAWKLPKTMTASEAHAKMLSPEAEQDEETSAIPETVAEKEADAKPKDEGSDSGTKPKLEDGKTTGLEQNDLEEPMPVNIQAKLSDSPRPGNVRQNLTAGGVPIELNINLNLMGCCHHGSRNIGNVHGQPNTNTTYCCGGRESIPEPMMPDLGESQEYQKMSETTEPPGTGTCPCPITGDLVMCGEEHPENRVYGIRSMLDFMQGEGSPCYAHQEESGGGMGIGSQLSGWWDSAVRAMTPNFSDESEISYADTVAGIGMVKRDEKSDTAERKDDGSASEGRDSEVENSEAFETGQGVTNITDETQGPSEKAMEDEKVFPMN